MINFQSAVSTFIIPKGNDAVRFISDFKKLNKTIKRKPFTITKHSSFITEIRWYYIWHINP